MFLINALKYFTIIEWLRSSRTPDRNINEILILENFFDLSRRIPE